MLRRGGLFFAKHFAHPRRRQRSDQAGLAFDRQSPNGAHFGSADVELGVKYRFIEADEDGWRPHVAFRRRSICLASDAAGRSLQNAAENSEVSLFLGYQLIF